MSFPKKVILAGFMGTGKSAIGAMLAKKLKYPFIDTDPLIEEMSQKTISEIFSGEGEGGFRQLERRAIERALSHEEAVIAVGGGAVCNSANLKKLRQAGPMVLLKARVPTILKRLKKTNDRPLLQVPDREAKIKELLAKRARFYDQIPWQLDTDSRSTAQLVQQVYTRLPLEDKALVVDLKERSYPIYFQTGSLASLNSLLKTHLSSERLVLITNTTVDRLHGRKVQRNLARDFKVHKIVLPDGERYKTLKTVEKIYRELVRFKVDRKTSLIALGGGVIGDIVGFAAASFLRGIPFVQIPTTLLAQVDSSIGGKTGVDLPEGKNLVGAFYQPKFVMIDAGYLTTLPRKQLVCGMAEVIKYGAAFDSRLFSRLEKEMGELLEKPGASLEPIIRRCCEIKAHVVERDEREILGIRSKLNFGHTLGHAVESLTGYRKFTHGEAIAMGMVAAAGKSVGKTGLAPKAFKRLKELLEKTGLPTALPPLGRPTFRRAIGQDKKRVSTQLNFVYLEKIGKSVVLPTALEEVI